MAGDLDRMLARSAAAAGGQAAAQALVGAYEAERLVDALEPTPLERVGDARFLAQHDAVQRLNLQAHHNAQTHSDEFVLELLVSRDKLPALVRELLVVEAWKERALPLLEEHLAGRVDSTVSYVCLHHEAAVANLLEVALFHRHAAEALGEAALLELADWCLRKLAHLNGGAAHAHANAPERGVQEALALPPLDELRAQRAETDFCAALCGLTLLRYLTEHLPHLPLGLAPRLLCTHDAVMALLPLVDSPPWVRTRKAAAAAAAAAADGNKSSGSGGGRREAFVGGRWVAVPPADRARLTQLDGQVWLSLVNLLADPGCRARYRPDEYRRGCILRLRRHLHSELLLDQLPLLRDLARALDEMALGADGSGGSGATGLSSAAAAAAAHCGIAGGGGGMANNNKHAAAPRALILEQVSTWREGLLRGRDWRALAAAQREAQFGDAARRLARERLQSMVRSFELMCELEQEQERHRQQPKDGRQQQAAAATSLADGGGADEAAVRAAPPVRVVVLRQTGGGLFEPWCEFAAPLDDARAAEDVAVVSEEQQQAAAAAASAASAGGGAGDGAGGGVRGRRFRLAPLAPEAARGLPMRGKVAVHFMGAVAEALLQLPEVPLRSTAAAGGDDLLIAERGGGGGGGSSAPAALWLTVGLLAADGFALQLRLRKAERPAERDRDAGGWCAYRPVGGAITVAAAAAGAPSPAAGGGGGGSGSRPSPPPPPKVQPVGGAATVARSAAAADTAVAKP